MATVPANPWLFCEMDRRLHHYRRYNKQQFRRLLTVNGAEIELLTYFNTFLFPPAAAVRYMSKIVKTRDATADLEVPPAFLNAIFEPIMKSEAQLLGRVPLPMGLSLGAVIRKPIANENSLVHSKGSSASA